MNLKNVDHGTGKKYFLWLLNEKGNKILNRDYCHPHVYILLGIHL